MCNLFHPNFCSDVKGACFLPVSASLCIHSTDSTGVDLHKQELEDKVATQTLKNITFMRCQSKCIGEMKYIGQYCLVQ